MIQPAKLAAAKTEIIDSDRPELGMAQRLGAFGAVPLFGAVPVFSF
jgi:hypothetical protein